MEFERSLYRVYERSVEAVMDEEDANRNGDPVYSKPCKFFEVLVFAVAIFFLVCFIALHKQIVGSKGCLPEALMVFNSTTNTSSPLTILPDTILGINVVSDKPFGDDDTDPGTDLGRRRLWLRGERNLRGMDEARPSRLSLWSSPEPSGDVDESNYHYNYDYMVAFSGGIVSLPDSLKEKHDFPVFNVSLSTEAHCFGFAGAGFFLPMGGMDTVVLNNVMYTTQTPGIMVTRYGEVFRWGSQDLQPYSRVSQWIRYKLSILLLSLTAFFFVITATALLVRTLISSGIVIIFPVIWLLRLCGINAFNLRLMIISYPWIGLPLQQILNTRRPIEPFLIGHMTRAVLYYTLYIAAQSLFVEWFYAYNGAVGLVQVFLYAIVMMWEYYSMIYVRSAHSILLFPKICLFLFLFFHFYYYSFPSGYHSVALTVVTLLSIVIMTHCVRVYETKAFRLGYVSIDQPRMLYNSVSWPLWRADLAPEYTLFMPVSAMTRGVYQGEVPRWPGGAADTAAPPPQPTPPPPPPQPTLPPQPAPPAHPNLPSSLRPQVLEPLTREVDSQRSSATSQGGQAPRTSQLEMLSLSFGGGSTTSLPSSTGNTNDSSVFDSLLHWVSRPRPQNYESIRMDGSSHANQNATGATTRNALHSDRIEEAGR